MLGLPFLHRGESRLDDCVSVTSRGIAIAYCASNSRLRGGSHGGRSLVLLGCWPLPLFHSGHIMTLHDIDYMSTNTKMAEDPEKSIPRGLSEDMSYPGIHPCYRPH